MMGDRFSPISGFFLMLIVEFMCLSLMFGDDLVTLDIWYLFDFGLELIRTDMLLLVGEGI